MDPILTILSVLAIILGGVVVLAAGIFLIGKLFGLTFLVLGNIFRFVGAEVADTLRFVGAILASVLFAPLVVLSVVIGRWSASKHYAGALMSELRAGSRCVYRVFVGNPVRLVGLSRALEGVEQRVPKVMAAAPTRDKPSKRVGLFEGYTIVGSLKSGGSGGKLYIAEPDEIKRAVFAKRKLGEIDRVVIKVFSLKDGSSLPQIVRESRALDSARSLGLVLEHQMTPDRFYYVMRFVPGESLSVVTQRLHAMCAAEGLDNARLGEMMGYAQDLLVSLDTYHNAELWHKDVKPDNIIVDGGGSAAARAHLVDFGLVTPMRSSMTLTTHGTEYFRDPELVRQALRGVKVHQIDGSRFDVYAAGAVLFSMIENSFPAHGGLSQLTKRCPEALRWIVRRAMAEYDRRYPSAAAMLADLRVVMNAPDPFKVKPIDLPSVSEGDVAAAERVESEPVPDFGGAPFVRAATPVMPMGPVDQEHRQKPHETGRRVGRPKARLTSWWSGRYVTTGGRPGPARAALRPDAPRRPRRPLRSIDDRRPAPQQVRDARQRAHDMRSRASSRINAQRKGKSDYSNTPGVVVIASCILGMGVLFVGGGLLLPALAPHRGQAAPVAPDAPAAPLSVRVGENEISITRGGSSVRVSSGSSLDKLPDVQASVLLVSLLPRPIERDVLDELEAKLDAMRSSGLLIRGDLGGGYDDDGVIELTADLQNALGSTPIDSPRLPLMIQQWLGGKPLDGVLMLTGAPGNAEDRSAMLVTGRFNTAVPLNDRAVHDLLLVLEGNGYRPQD